MHLIRKLVCSLYCLLCITLSEGRRLPQDETENNNFFDPKYGSECSTILMKSVADLLLSEYNRVESTNQKLYLLSRDPYVVCTENDVSSCMISFEIQASDCHRFSSKQGCQVGPERHTKTCVGVVNPTKIEIKSPLMCQDNDDSQSKLGNGFRQLESTYSDSNQDPRTKMVQKMIKKQWGDCGGNIYPL